MKKAYSKPDILFEDFSLSTSIATGCEVKTDTPHENTCGYQHGAHKVFINDVVACHGDNAVIVAEGEAYNGFCYHNPTSLNNLFNS